MANTVAMQLYSLKDFEGGWDAAFGAVKAMGIDTIEPWSGAVPNDPGATTSLADLRAALGRAGMKLTCGHVALGEFDDRYEAWRDLLRDLGSRTWVIPFAKAEDLAGWRSNLSRFRVMAERLAADGLALGYHNHHMELVRMGGTFVMEHLLDEMPELRAQFHIGQFLPERGISLPEWIRRYRGRVCSLHVNDADAGGAAAVGAGSCRAEESIRAALETGVDTFIVEVRLVRATLDAVRRDVDTTRKLVG